jgi:hypothetical protein
LKLQHPLIGANRHWCVSGLHASVVQTLPSLQSASRLQQPGIGVFEHPFGPQVSNVHALLSLHCVVELQQPGIGGFVHVPVSVLQTSVVHALLSLHCELLVQQFGIGGFEHVPVI